MRAVEAAVSAAGAGTVAILCSRRRRRCLQEGGRGVRAAAAARARVFSGGGVRERADGNLYWSGAELWAV